MDLQAIANTPKSGLKAKEPYLILTYLFTENDLKNYYFSWDNRHHDVAPVRNVDVRRR